MQTAGEFYGTFDSSDKRLLVRIRGLLSAIPDRGHPNSNGDHLWSCHALCYAVYDYLGLSAQGWEVVQGRFNGFDHCWLFRAERAAILDVYPVASSGGPIMFDASTHYIYTLYWPGETYSHTRSRAPEDAAVIYRLMADVDNRPYVEHEPIVHKTPASAQDIFDQRD